jgi:hypothetical protein
MEIGRTKLGRQSFVGDAKRLWNNAPAGIKSSYNIRRCKKAKTKFCKDLPK